MTQRKPDLERIAPLTSKKSIASEMRRIYRAARLGKLDLIDAKGFMWLLSQLSSHNRQLEIEQQLNELEKIYADHKRQNKKA